MKQRVERLKDSLYCRQTMMLSHRFPQTATAIRRLLLTLLLLCVAATMLPQQVAAAETRDPREFFFAQSFGDLPEELAEARAAGKLGLLLFFEQEGCPYCERMLKTVLNQPDVQDWYRERFVSIAVDINGDVELRDVDGITLPSKVFAEHRRVKTTPTLSFIDLGGAEIYRRVTMVSGPAEFMMMGQYIAEGRYTDTAWKDYAAEHPDVVNSATVRQVVDFRLEAAEADAGGANLLLAVTREGCSYCAQLRREILAPMIRSGEYVGKVRIREMMMEPDTAITDFSGEATTTGQVAARYGVRITPTVLLLDSSGRSLRPPIIGINNVEMYGFYLDQAIAEAAAEQQQEN
jgi:thioredoxin-related protein